MTFVVTGAACLVHSYPLAVRLTISSHETQRPYGSAEVCCLLEAEADYSIDWKLVFDISGASNFVAQEHYLSSRPKEGRTAVRLRPDKAKLLLAGILGGGTTPCFQYR
ncbi:hypothetical protein Csa_014175 [Cucumis sativus]|uniref:Uncharacterized protein n=1 Tax=Cucumis sativus TaxID=3659 RepID=A0A0A0LNI6_CUCSA|nr:hypothetical protein Csa_014175 [Cucumis sativus]